MRVRVGFNSPGRMSARAFCVVLGVGVQVRVLNGGRSSTGMLEGGI